MQFSYLARQGKVFRGDDESATASNKGNFFELVKMFSQYHRNGRCQNILNTTDIL